MKHYFQKIFQGSGFRVSGLGFQVLVLHYDPKAVQIVKKDVVIKLNKDYSENKESSCDEYFYGFHGYFVFCTKVSLHIAAYLSILC